MTYHSFRPGRIWLDTDGKRIQAHGGSIITVDGTFYWYGENKEKTTGADNIWHWEGPYEILGNPHAQDPSKTSFNSQITSVFRHPKKKDLYIALADRWKPEICQMDGYKTGEYSDKVQEKFRRIFDPEVEFVFTEEDAKEMKINSSLSDYVWLPLKFEGEQVKIEWRDEWTTEEYPDL